MTTNLVDEHDTTVLDTVNATEAGTTAAQDDYPRFLRRVDPQKLRADGNSRVVGDIRERRPELVASVAEHGVNPMVSVINVAPHPDDGVLDVLVGFHRTAAAVAVKQQENPALLIDVLVHAPGTTRQDVLVAQGIENIHREGYTQAEEAGLYEQLAITGLDEDAIAQQLTRPVERVCAGRAVVASARTHAASEALPGTDLLALAQLTEFADNAEDHQKLVEVLNTRPRDLEWTIGQLRRRREKQAKQIDEARRLTEQGYILIENEYDLPEGVARLDELCTGEDQTPLEDTGHSDCPGRAAAVDVDSYLEVEITQFCVDYAAHGHRTIASVKIAAAQAQLHADGVPIADPDAEGLAELRDLFADAQAERTLTTEEHAGCPGHAAYVEDEPYRSTADVTYVCIDFAAHGHVLRTSLAAEPEHSAAFKAAEVKRAGENNKLWRDAKVDRRAWLIKLFTGWRKRKPAELPSRVHHWLALAPVLASDYLADAAPAHRYAATLLKLAQPEGHQRDRNPLAVLLRKKTTSETQAVLIRLAQVIGACEEHWDRAYTEKSADASWRKPSEDTRFYFELLDALGYPLSHIEQLINNPGLDVANWPHLAPDTAADDQAA